MLETEFVGDMLEMLVTFLAVSVTNIVVLGVIEFLICTENNAVANIRDRGTKTAILGQRRTNSFYKEIRTAEDLNFSKADGVGDVQIRLLTSAVRYQHSEFFIEISID